MDQIDHKILSYLTEKDKASEAAVINETFKGFGIEKEAYVKRLEKLQQKDYIRYERPFGSGAFIYITEKGRYALKPFCKKIREYAAKHFLEILVLIVAVLTFILTI